MQYYLNTGFYIFKVNFLGVFFCVVKVFLRFIQLFFSVIDSRPTEAAQNIPRKSWLWNRSFEVSDSAALPVPDKGNQHPAHNHFNSFARQHTENRLHSFNGLAFSSLIVPSTVSPKLQQHPEPLKIQRLPLRDATRAHREALQGSRLYASLNEERRDSPVMRLSGEEGKTIASDHFERFDSLTDMEAENFLHEQLHRDAVREPDERVFEDQFPNVEEAVASTSIPNSTTSQTSSSKESKRNSEARLRGIFQDLVRQLGLVVSDSASDYKMDVNISLRKVLKRSKRIVNNRHLYVAENSGQDARRSDPQITLNLQITL